MNGSNTIFPLTRYLQSFPTGTTVLGAQGHGASNWTRTARVDTRSVDGVEKSFFLKVAPGDRGRGMMLGEFESMAAIYNIVPTFVPRPIAWGTFEVLISRDFFAFGSSSSDKLDGEDKC